MDTHPSHCVKSNKWHQIHSHSKNISVHKNGLHKLNRLLWIFHPMSSDREHNSFMWLTVQDTHYATTSSALIALFPFFRCRNFRYAHSVSFVYLCTQEIARKHKFKSLASVTSTTNAHHTPNGFVRAYSNNNFSRDSTNHRTYSRFVRVEPLWRTNALEFIRFKSSVRVYN